MKPKTYLILVAVLFSLIVISPMLFKRLTKVSVNFTVGNRAIEGVQQVKIASSNMQNGICFDDKKTINEFAAHFNTATYEKSDVKKLETFDFYLMLTYELHGDVGRGYSIIVSKDTIDVNGTFYKCDPELYNFLKSEHNRLMQERGLSSK